MHIYKVIVGFSFISICHPNVTCYSPNTQYCIVMQSKGTWVVTNTVFTWGSKCHTLNNCCVRVSPQLIVRTRA